MENSAFVDVLSSLVDAKKTKQFFPGSSAEGSRGIWRCILLMALADMMSLCVSWVSISGDFWFQNLNFENVSDEIWFVFLEMTGLFCPKNWTYGST